MREAIKKLANFHVTAISRCWRWNCTSLSIYLIAHKILIIKVSVVVLCLEDVQEYITIRYEGHSTVPILISSITILNIDLFHLQSNTLPQADNKACYSVDSLQGQILIERFRQGELTNETPAAVWKKCPDIQLHFSSKDKRADNSWGLFVRRCRASAHSTSTQSDNNNSQEYSSNTQDTSSTVADTMANNNNNNDNDPPDSNLAPRLQYDEYFERHQSGSMPTRIYYLNQHQAYLIATQLPGGTSISEVNIVRDSVSPTLEDHSAKSGVSR